MDIGCSFGFLSIELARFAESITGFDINPYCIRIADIVAHYLQVNNTRFLPITFEDYQEQAEYDVVLSLANHHTFDQNTHQSLQSYFQKCATYLKPGGLLLFESHAVCYETPEQLEKVIQVIAQFFDIRERRVLNKGNRVSDRGRTFCVCVKK
ncbi:MAG: class I SAM-dependent methyltransferase [Opitutales bacterium]|nr:class I SAM-dependent methyltransferase [Opitutales bacterium]